MLLIDLDPQCNSTQLILSADENSYLYWPKDQSEPLFADAAFSRDTIYTAVQPLEEGESRSPVPSPIAASMNRFAVDLIPGHPRMSMFEDRLGPWFREASAGSVEGLRRTLWLETLLENYEDQYDVVLFDIGPSLGALNRSVLSASDYFITPMGADIFSIVALRNIAEWIISWTQSYEQGAQLCLRNNPGALERWDLPTELKIRRGFAGYTVQQYSTVSIRGERRATTAYDQIMNQIPMQVARYLVPLADPKLSSDHLQLGDLPNLRSLVPLAQSANAPLPALTSRDGLTGGQYSQQRSYSELIDRVGARLTENCLR